MKKIIFLVVTMALFSACKNSSESQVELTSADFSVIDVTGKDVSTYAVSMNINLEENRISGKGGCNGYGGEIEQGKGNKISIGKVIGTKMFCKETMDIENSLLQSFEKITTYAFDGEILQLKNEEGTTLIKAKITKKQE